jgi:hypothetical protein
MNRPPHFTVRLDRDREIAFTQRALFRMGTLPAPFEFEDLRKPRKSYAALVAWLWACLSPGDAADLPTPEDVAEHVPAEREACERLARAVVDAINASVPKKAPGSTPGSSGASSSA